MLPHVAVIRLCLLLCVGRYPLAVKLGTITPNGADVYSYAPEEDNMVKVCGMLFWFFRAPTAAARNRNVGACLVI